MIDDGFQGSGPSAVADKFKVEFISSELMSLHRDRSSQYIGFNNYNVGPRSGRPSAHTQESIAYRLPRCLGVIDFLVACYFEMESPVCITFLDCIDVLVTGFATAWLQFGLMCKSVRCGAQFFMRWVTHLCV